MADPPWTGSTSLFWRAAVTLPPHCLRLMGRWVRDFVSIAESYNVLRADEACEIVAVTECHNGEEHSSSRQQQASCSFPPRFPSADLSDLCVTSELNLLYERRKTWFSHPGISRPSTALQGTSRRSYECYLPMGFQESKAATIKVIIFHILLCLLTFYTIYYMIGSVCCGVFRLNSFDARLPFDFKTEPLYSNPNYLVNVISMEITFWSSGLFFAVLLKQWVWDYALTVTSVHLLLTWAVMEEFPLVWQWWLALACGLFLMVCNGELITYFAYSDSNSPHMDSFF